VDEFLDAVHEGLMKEHRRKPAHNPAYIAWSLNQLRQMLDRFNGLVARNGKGPFQPDEPADQADGSGG
jgi:hypothetical protein